MPTFAIYKEGTNEWVQALEPFTLVDLTDQDDLDPIEVYYFETEEDAQDEADNLTDQHQIEFRVGRPDDRHGH